MGETEYLQMLLLIKSLFNRGVHVRAGESAAVLHNSTGLAHSLLNHNYLQVFNAMPVVNSTTKECVPTRYFLKIYIRDKIPTVWWIKKLILIKYQAHFLLLQY